MPANFKKWKKKRQATSKGKRKKSRSYRKVLPTVGNYYQDLILIPSREKILDIKHPNHELWFRNQIAALCRKALSTQTVELLEKLSETTEDAFSRGLLAKKIHLLRVGYLQSFKEYSDRALTLLAEREKEFDQWEGIYILGCFGKDSALKYLQTRAATEPNKLLLQTIKRAIENVGINKKKRKQKRGFS